MVPFHKFKFHNTVQMSHTHTHFQFMPARTRHNLKWNVRFTIWLQLLNCITQYTIICLKNILCTYAEYLKWTARSEGTLVQQNLSSYKLWGIIWTFIHALELVWILKAMDVRNMRQEMWLCLYWKAFIAWFVEIIVEDPGEVFLM